MKKKSTSKSAFFNLRVLIASVLCLFGVFVALLGSGVFAQTKTASQQPARSNATQDAPGTQTPDVVPMVGPVILNTDLRKLPYVAPKAEFDEQALMRYPHGTSRQERKQITAFQASRTSSGYSKVCGARRPQCRLRY